MRAKRAVLSLLVSMGTLATTWAQTTIINTGFTAGDGYADGDLVNNANWTEATTNVAKMLKVADAAGSGAVTTSTSVYDALTDAVFFGTPVGNAVDDEITFVQDLVLNKTTNDWKQGIILSFGLSSITTNSLNKSSQADLTFRLAKTFTGNGSIALSVGDQETGANVVTLADLNGTETGWDAEGSGMDLISQTIRITAKIRKTGTSGYYALSGKLENLDSGSNETSAVVYQTRTNIYNAGSSDYIFQYEGKGAALNSGGHVELTVSNLSVVVTNGVAPTALATPTVTADSGVGQVGLSWLTVPDASEYIVKRTAADAGSGGPYSVLATVTTNGYSESGLANGSVYYYIVTATNTALALSADSPATAGTPDFPPAQVTGTFIDTTFTNAALYSNGDLARQDDWRANANSVPNAFTVDTAGNGFAMGFANAAKTNDSSVYWRDFNTNTIGAVWSGTIKFKVNATNAQTAIRSDGATIAVLNPNAYPIFGWGISSDVAGSDFFEPHSGSGFGFSDDAVLRAWVSDTGSIKFGLNNRFHGSADILQLSSTELGWEPTSTDTNIMPDFETDLVELTWWIRKSGRTNDYSAFVTATVGTNVYPGVINYNNTPPNNLWAAPVAQFAMQHVVDANDLLDVYVDAVSVTHTNSSDIPVTAPINLSGTLDSSVLAVNLNWGSIGGEETGGFNIYRSSTGIDPGDFSLLTNVTGMAFQDTDVTNQTVYIYKVSGLFPSGESATSDNFAIRALTTAQVTGMFYSAPGGNGTLTGTLTPSYTSSTSNGIVLKVNSGFSGSKVPSAGSLDAKYHTDKSPLVYGWLQEEAATPVATHTFWAKSGEDRLRYRNSNGGTNSSLDYVKVTVPVNAATGKLIMYAGKWGNTRAAIRNNGIWYASQTVADNTEQIIDLATEPFTVFTEPQAGDGFVDPSGGSFSTVNFSQVDAVGVLRGANVNTVNAHIKYWSLVAQDSATDYQNWAFGQGLYNADAAFTNDYDADGVSNGEEWGLGGDPANANSTGIQARRTAVNGTDFIFMYPRMIATPRPVYNVVADDNLAVAPGFITLTNGVDYTETFGGTWTTNGNGANFEVVSNAYPTALDPTVFFKLEITEP